MSVFARLRSLLTTASRRKRFDDALDEEVRFHLENAAGTPPQTPHRACDAPDAVEGEVRGGVPDDALDGGNAGRRVPDGP